MSSSRLQHHVWSKRDIIGTDRKTVDPSDRSDVVDVVEQPLQCRLSPDEFAYETNANYATALRDSTDLAVGQIATMRTKLGSVRM